MRRRVIGLVVVSALVIVGLNTAGLLRYPGGPLRQPGSNGLLWLDGWPKEIGEAAWCRLNWMPHYEPVTGS